MTKEINIPKEDFESLIELINLSENEFGNLVKKIDQISFLDSLEKIEEKLKDITNNYKLILGLFYTFCKFDLSENSFIDILFNYCSEKLGGDINKEDFEKKMLSFFGKNNPIRISIKSKIISSDLDCIFYDSKILTDIRPVFSSKEEKDIIAKVVINNLKITFRRNDELEDFYVGLDKEDLETLKMTIDRALEKTELLNNINI